MLPRCSCVHESVWLGFPELRELFSSVSLDGLNCLLFSVC
jgi:hypothetical protein